MHKEKLGALIDGIYAIALTILVLDLPKPETAENLIDFIPKIQYSFIDYSLSFFLLFAFGTTSGALMNSLNILAD
ncbi:MAG: DUF1211 domain-containing protein [Leptolyngbyaceae cyanobacterium CRU_2_3]|nr:DUF1211 domain-containing protein [Leptolyngbyaceae cyanobacterium CRU_2_3]